VATSPYKLPLKSYCAVYGVSYRTILRWKEAGLPLDDEPQTRAMLATGARPGAQLLTNAPVTVSDGSLGLSGAVARLKQAEAAANAEYQAAVASGDAAQAAIAEKRWLSLVESLRRNEVSNPEVAEANKNTVPVKEVESALNELFQKLRQDLETMPKRIALELIGRDELGVREVLKRETGEIISALFLCKYLEGGNRYE
jgi:hypothetical protein